LPVIGEGEEEGTEGFEVQYPSCEPLFRGEVDYLYNYVGIVL
jgi:hypothetical protein